MKLKTNILINNLYEKLIKYIPKELPNNTFNLNCKYLNLSGRLHSRIFELVDYNYKNNTKVLKKKLFSNSNNVNSNKYRYKVMKLFHQGKL